MPCENTSPPVPGTDPLDVLTVEMRSAVDRARLLSLQPDASLATCNLLDAVDRLAAEIAALRKELNRG